jgi:hypothetical protein
MCAVHALDMSLSLIKYNQLPSKTLIYHISKLQIKNVKYEVKYEAVTFSDIYYRYEDINM